MAINEIELQEQLKETGNRLLDPPSSIDELLNMLDKLECLLINVEQAPSRSMQDALLSPMKALISNALLRNSDTDVKVSVVSCISEITRITAPDAPYSDDHMKGQVMLGDVGPELDELIIKMFQHFLKIIRSNHPPAVFFAMETIMTLIIDESEDISVGLLTPLLASIRKENQYYDFRVFLLLHGILVQKLSLIVPLNLNPMSRSVQAIGIALDEFAPIVASICQDESLTLEQNHVNGSGDYLGLSPVAASPGEVFQAVDAIPKSTTKGIVRLEMLAMSSSVVKVLMQQGDAEAEVNLEMEPGTIARKRGWKPNSLMNPEEGYDHSWISAGRKNCKITLFYEGVLDSYDPIKKKHKVLYADGDEEILNLRRERWELIGGAILPDEEPKTDIPNADPSSDKSRATSISKRKARKSAGAVTQDEPIVADKAMDDTSRPNSGAEGDGKGSTGKLKIGVRGLESTASRKL
ncbi:hypothetical protein GH714_025241 [Hevea brasiliensis]|uniref:Tudor domain-containing protein n=1 Tax=Hevea brasiliensis TaxID=3981 RepID=A0A6A6LN54_HEVBR|nr:hypothetical protein GH714_025241 [Hevea brasiliensis]